MNPAQKVIKNSTWLIIQPLILNIISIFVIGYIARTLGQADYGKFVFAFAFVSMFASLDNMGLRLITVREITEDSGNAGEFLGRMLILRFFLVLCAFSLIIFIINLLHYSISTKIIVYIAAVAMILDTVTTTFKDAFQAFEKMQYIAYTQFISGFILTVLSVLVLFFGYRLVELTLVYMFGSLLALLVSSYYLLKKFVTPRLKFDLSFWKSNLYKGAPFFYPNIASAVGGKIGIIFLSKIAGDIGVGIYGVAANLIERLLIIPDGICTSYFPTMASIYRGSKSEAKQLFQRFFLYQLLLGLPIAIGITILAKPIICLIFGSKYLNSIVILRILSWGLFLSFLTLFLKYSLNAIHREKKTALSTFITVPCYIIVNFMLIAIFKEIGAAISFLLDQIFQFLVLVFFVKKYLCSGILELRAFINIILVNALLGFFVFFFRDYNFFLLIPMTIIAYIFFLLVFRLIKLSELALAKEVIFKKLTLLNKFIGAN